MSARPHAPLLVALLVGSTLLVPASAQAGGGHEAALRGGLSMYAHGGRAPARAMEARVAGGRREIAVSVELAGPPDPAIRSRLQAAGMTTRGAWQSAIEGYIAPSNIEALALVDGVVSIEPVRRPIEASFVGPAPAIHGAAAWQQVGFSGAGVKVGILDEGFEGFAGLLGNELPATVQARCYAQIGIATTTLGDCVTAGEYHGTAVAESIIDMAPQASLYVSNAQSRADIAATVRWMTAAGVRVINFSQGALLEGMGDGTSPYSNSFYALSDLAISGGALFVASAGNAAETTWVGPPVDADSNGWLEFGPGDDSNTLDLTAGDELFLGIRWPTATADYDVSIWQGPIKLAESADVQAATRDPLEVIDFAAPTSGTYSVRISHHSGTSTAASVRLMILTSADTRLNYLTLADSLPAPADSRNPGLLTVGAVNYVTPGTVEPYSSQGPTLDGRTKPDLVAVDCAPTTVVAVFCGTSEAAPFVSGAAALLVESDPNATPAQLAGFLRSHAAPIGSPVPNNASGFGLLSLGALTIAVPASTSFVSPAASGAAGAAFLGQPVVGILDSTGAPVAIGPGSKLAVTLSLANNPGGGTLSCAGGLTAVAVAGIARFSGCAIDAAGSGYTLRAQVSGLPDAMGAPFDVGPAGAPPLLTLAASAATITYGATVTFSVLAASPAGTNLALEDQAGSGGVFTSLGSSATDATGAARWTNTPKVGRDYRVVSIAPSTGTVEVSAPVRVKVNATAAGSSSIPTGRTISRTTKLTVTTLIRPIGAIVARGRARFDLFQRTSAGWTRRRIIYADAGSDGRARATLTLSSIGSWWIRSRAEPTTTNGPSTWTAGFRYAVR
jgi:Subtilase family